MVQQDSVLGWLGYDLLVHVMMVAFAGLSHTLRRCDIARHGGDDCEGDS